MKKYCKGVSKLLLLLPIVALIVGCGGDEEVGTKYLPLSVGNEWNYDVTVTVTNPDTTLTGSMELEITAETTLDNGTEVFEMVQTMTNDTTDTYTFYFEETENYILEYDSKAATVPADTFLALPLEVGKTWGDYQVLGQADVTVPAGTFNDCWEILETSHGTAYYYFAADVGLVKLLWTETAGSSSMETLMELETYYVE